MLHKYDIKAYAYMRLNNVEKRPTIVAKETNYMRFANVQKRPTVGAKETNSVSNVFATYVSVVFATRSRAALPPSFYILHRPRCCWPLPEATLPIENTFYPSYREHILWPLENTFYGPPLPEATLPLSLLPLFCLM